MRTVLPFNDGWLYCPEDVPDDAGRENFEPVTLPHTNKIFPHHNFDNREYEFVSTYRKYFKLPEPLNGRHLYIDFEGAMIAATVTINGHTFEEHRGGFVPFSYDITAYMREDGENLLTVHLDSSERKDIPPYGYVVDYLTFGGLYREVQLRYVEPVHTTDIFIATKNVLAESPIVVFDVQFANDDSQTRTCSFSSRFVDTDTSLVDYHSDWTDLTIPPKSRVNHRIEMSVSDPILWTLDAPVLYQWEVELRHDASDSQSIIESQCGVFGIREAEFRKDGFYLNGEKTPLIGLNRHQTYPYIGAAAPARLQRRDADIIKYELGCNIVRTSHYPQSRHFLDRCDEIGLLVFEEIPGWQHIGDAAWQALAARDLVAMIKRDRNRPSIVLWGVRINESLDDDGFYEEMNTLAHELDPTRQTGGVRYFQESRMLEDVFTFNDFSNTIVEPIHTPHLVTEFNGHMFPTKSWDQEERLIEHALRHAHIQDKQLGMDNVVGAIGWCAFDYNTHKEFGSGDRICYHGVSDIFRIPKYAAYFYASQTPPEQRVVLQAATVWSMGDRSGGGNDPLVIFSNCDEIEVTIGETLLGRFQPNRETYPHLPHPPFQIRGLGMRWGEDFGDLHIVGYLNGEAVAQQSIDAEGLPHALTLEADDNELFADGADMTRLVFKIVDKYGNRLPYTNQVVTFEIDGPADLIGENPFALMGGQAALYLKARHEAGIVTIRATTPRLPAATVSLTMRL
ncbi:MAG: hypothetical protein D6737_13120 [Chloroflexi bacterium]|nr:MAG: hypothetical protein D6737_13120 [Chloroflexota bacterium]